MKKFSLKSISAVATALFTLVALSGCFTGIESTAKIKASGSDDAKTVSNEQKLLSEVRNERPADWRRGKPFMLTEGRAELAFMPSSVSSQLEPGDTLFFQDIKETVRLAGDSVADISFRTSDGQEITHRVETSMSRLADFDKLVIPFTVDLDLVDDVRNILLGRQLWTLRFGSSGRKFDAVKVADVIAGDAEFPVVVIAGQDSVPMVLESRSMSARTFDNLFSLTDPRKNYPQITDENWELICKGKIAVDMTREECRLALGAPGNVERETAYSGLIEHWTYQNGIYLMFIDGVLTRFRL